MVNLWVYLIRVLVFIQPVFWWYIWDSNIKIPYRYKDIIVFFGGLFVFIVSQFKISFEYYSTSLLVQYTFFVIICFLVFSSKYSIKDSLCIAFMITYLNSFYWEIVLHFAEYTQNLVNLNFFINIRELWRLTPIFFFLWYWDYNKSYTLKWLRIGLIPSFIIAYLNFNVFTFEFGLNYPFIADYINFIRQALFFINRFVSLSILVKIVYDAKLDMSHKLFKRVHQ